VLTTDVCVPISKLAKSILQAEQDAHASQLPCTLVGHVGDGNYHLLIVIDPTDHAQVARAKQLSAQVVDTALKLGGTCTGEHGIGVGKKDYLKVEHATAINMMKSIKMALDPKNIMNPGKIFDL